MAWNGSDPNAVSVKPQRKKRRIPALAWIVVGAIVAVAAISCLMVGVGGKDAGATQSPTPKRKIQKNANRFVGSPEEVVRRAMPAGMAKKPRKRPPRAPVDIFADLKGKDRKLAEAVQAALDKDDLEATLVAAKAALQSENAEVRQNAVEALGWFGMAALPELTGCMADPDEDVRQAAGNLWELSVQEVENSSQRFAIVAAAFATLSDEDQLTSLGGILNGAAMEMIDGEEDEEFAAENRVAVLQTLVDIIESGRSRNIQAAKEAYNDITGNEWMGLDEAERYLDDPENYDPDGDVSTEAVNDDESVDVGENTADMQSEAEQPMM